MKSAEECDEYQPTEYQPVQSVPSEQPTEGISLDFKNVPVTGQDITQQELLSSVFMDV